MKTFLILMTIFSLNVFGLQIKGEAYVAGKLSYVENHEAVLNADGSYKKLKTTYSRNEKFAEIESDFTNNLFLPNSVFFDKRFNLKESILVEDKRIVIKRESNGKIKESFVKIEDQMIVGQGFHNYIVKNFEQILNNKKEILMVVPAKSDFFRFKIEVTDKNTEDVELIVRPSNIFLKQLVEKIVLRYEIKTKRLKSFKGPSNLDNDQEEGQNVEIKYSY